MPKKAGKAKGRKRVTVKDLAAKKGGARGGALLLPAVHKVQQKVRLTDITDGTSNTL
jgi:hypothetical protein